MGKLINKYKVLSWKFLEELVGLKKTIYEAFQEKAPTFLHIDSTILNHPYLPDLNHLSSENDRKKLIEQKINEQKEFLSQILEKPTRIERIFKASEHCFRADAFH